MFRFPIGIIKKWWYNYLVFYAERTLDNEYRHI